MKTRYVFLLIATVLPLLPAEMPYGSMTSYNPTSTASDQLTPVYKTATKEPYYAKATKGTFAVETNVTKSLLNNNSLRPNTKTMQNLSHTMFTFVTDELYKDLTQKTQLQNLVYLITEMNNAKKQGLHEDLMGQFAYNNKPECSDYDEDISLIPSLFFTLLKKYSLTAYENQETVPTIASSGITDLTKYPAFLNLFLTLQHALEEVFFDAINIFLTHIHANQNILLENYSKGSYTNLKNEIYTKIAGLLFEQYSKKSSMDILHDLVQIFDRAKRKGNIQFDDKFTSSILAVEPNAMAKFQNILYPSHSENTKNRMILFFNLMKNYKRARFTRANPTSNQCLAYSVKKELDITLSDEHNKLLDEKQYAFTEFENLFEETKNLKELDNSQVKKKILLL